MTVLSKEKVIEKIEEIRYMDFEELREFDYILASSDVDDKARKFLQKAIDIRMSELMALEEYGDPFAVDGEIREGEI